MDKSISSFLEVLLTVVGTLFVVLATLLFTSAANAKSGEEDAFLAAGYLFAVLAVAALMGAMTFAMQRGVGKLASRDNLKHLEVYEKRGDAVKLGDNWYVVVLSSRTGDLFAVSLGYDPPRVFKYDSDKTRDELRFQPFPEQGEAGAAVRSAECV